jgi:hypothetical protein
VTDATIIILLFVRHAVSTNSTIGESSQEMTLRIIAEQGEVHASKERYRMTLQVHPLGVGHGVCSLAIVRSHPVVDESTDWIL